MIRYCLDVCEKANLNNLTEHVRIISGPILKNKQEIMQILLRIIGNINIFTIYSMCIIINWNLSMICKFFSFDLYTQ